MTPETEARLATLKAQFPRAHVYALTSGRWAAHTSAGLISADSADLLEALLDEIYGEPCPVIPLRRPGAG